MKTLEKLLSRFWVIKEKEPDLYYKIRDEEHKYRDFLREKLGYTLRMDAKFIKLEKIVAKAESWMGIESFKRKTAYVFLSILLMFLEDKEEEEQFILSELTEYMEDSYPEERLDWTLSYHRYDLVDVLRFAVDEGILRLNDGVEEEFRSNQEAEVLYENTGLSKFFMRFFQNSIEGFSSLEDFESQKQTGNPTILRRQDVYRRLLTSLALYHSVETEDAFLYLKNYRKIVEEDFSKYLDAKLQLHSQAAFLLLGEGSSFGKVFPDTSMLSNLTLLLHAKIREKVEKEEVHRDFYDCISMDKTVFYEILRSLRESYGELFSKEFRVKKEEKLQEEVLDYMKSYAMVVEDAEHLLWKPIVGKLIGCYAQKAEGEGNEG